MAGLDPGEFGRGAAAREDARVDYEQDVLRTMLSAGWSDDTVAAALQLHEEVADAVNATITRGAAPPCNQTALNLVGEARGTALADWWSDLSGVDTDTRELLRRCAAAAAGMAMVDGFMLGARRTPAGVR